MMQKYSVEKIDIKKYKYCLLKFITQNHKNYLAVVAGRLHKPRPRSFNESLCIVYDRQQLEDQYHFILEFKMYHDLRQRYIPQSYWIEPSMDMLVKLFGCTKIHYCRFIYLYF